MTYSSLLKNDIYTIPIGDMWNVPQDDLFFIYSPLSGHIMIANKAELAEIERVCAGESPGSESQTALLDQMKQQRNLNVYQIPPSCHGITEVDLLLNFKCNFKCSYCYSAAGRSSKEASFDQVKAVIDYLFADGKTQSDPYRINFSGGGEPLLSFPLIKKAVEYTKEKARGTSLKYTHGLVTNGSLLTEEIIDFIKEENISLVVSFEVLKEFQDLERGNYDTVARNIDLLLEKECPFGIRATITPLSVGSMSEMVRELSVRFPQLKAIVFDTVLSADIFKTPADLTRYYDDFSESYWQAKEYGAGLGIEVACNAIELSGILRTRTCRGKIVMTPEGAISSCARVSSPQEELYDKFIYGSVNRGSVELDNDKFLRMMDDNNIFTREECRECYARWNCGAGCWLFSKSFPADFEEPFCTFTKKSLRKDLFEVVSRRHNSMHRQKLWDFVNGQIK